MIEVTPEDLRRFWAKVDKNGPITNAELGPCWIWLGAKRIKGYGEFHFLGKKMRAHRVVWAFTHGRWPDPYALHRCDTRACVNPAHLFEGTNEDNIADMLAKGRAIGRAEHFSAALKKTGFTP